MKYTKALQTAKHIVVAISASVMLSMVLSSCDKTKSSELHSYELISIGKFDYDSVSAVDYYASEMHYKVFIYSHGVFVVNITKDSMDVIKNKH